MGSQWGNWQETESIWPSPCQDKGSAVPNMSRGKAPLFASFMTLSKLLHLVALLCPPLSIWRSAFHVRLGEWQVTWKAPCVVPGTEEVLVMMAAEGCSSCSGGSGTNPHRQVCRFTWDLSDVEVPSYFSAFVFQIDNLLPEYRVKLIILSNVLVKTLRRLHRCPQSHLASPSFLSKEEVTIPLPSWSAFRPETAEWGAQGLAGRHSYSIAQNMPTGT